MHATIRRYEGVDAARTNEVVGKGPAAPRPSWRRKAGRALICGSDGGGGNRTRARLQSVRSAMWSRQDHAGW
jgi:hypothetical protein